MKVALFSVNNFEKPFLLRANEKDHHELNFFEGRLTTETAKLAAEFPAVSCFITDDLNKAVLTILAQGNTRTIALRSAGFNHVDIETAKKLGLVVTRVPAYSPYAVAEFATGLILALNRKIHRAYARVREQNFSLDGLIGFDLHNRTIGIVGTGKIGTLFAKIMHGFGCKLLAVDLIQNDTCKNLGVTYVNYEELYQQSDIISLHCPLTADTHHLINESVLMKMKTGVMLINTGRGALIDTKAIVQGLKNGKVGYLGIDVYEEEENLLFHNLSETIIQDDVFARLLTFPNVIVTGHQAFFTEEALINIATTTLNNITAFERGSADIFKV
ncbi:MAG: hydroxyacid dehydrogenase [Gammaproteobacteria bacterium CG_4_10_14_0_8_um_filter_38_16]|nr:MAG: hydroxyacid dehydrogenase [Gammaproteobacteria bacterium CG_4_10_14_0_8_um_filter_38_16]PJA02831.1 MAG: hydroxyacid dehydrogenase [Gammaproteobacteria bacterium CG_4_10_14_0_2_um_filter_38_22]PJB10696.1 MAG: hydroxyacid dehydrogenase [Gammaproteobacteria bacterium CG_4_9_14_3_um_filter_38_9]